ncbi:MAG: DUF1847 domain-containing protein [Candidatus Thermoplasmatota archaeon]
MKYALCKDKKCYEGEDCTKIKEKALEKYVGNDRRILTTAASTEADYYMKYTRLEELIDFARQMNYKRLGIAFCIGLQEEAELLHRILESNFEVFSVICKVCGINKEDLNLKKLHGYDFEAICNPIGQAIVLNDKNTDLNVIVGLCIGHDILFTEHSKAPVTTLVVKDRVLAHNPLGAIYSGYHRKPLEGNKG